MHRLVIKRAVLPASEQNTDPFESKRSNGGMMGLATCAMLPVVVFSPSRTSDGMQCPLVKGLPQELRAGSTVVNPVLLTAAFDNWSNAAITLNLVGRSVPVAMSAESSN